MNVTNMSWNHSKLIYNSQINDSRCQLWSWYMLTSRQPLIRRTNTSLSCCPVWTCLISQQSKLNYKYSIHHTRTRVTFVLLLTIRFDYKNTWKSHYSMNCHWKWHQRSRKIIGIHLYVPSVTRNWRVTKWNIIHMWQVNTWMVLRWSIMRLDSTSVHVARSAIYNSHSTRRTIDCQCTSTMDLIITSYLSWNSSYW